MDQPPPLSSRMCPCCNLIKPQEAFGGKKRSDAQCFECKRGRTKRWEEKRLSNPDSPLCVFDGCDKVAMKRDMCGAHYKYWREWINPAIPQCAIDGCERRGHKQGLCTAHHYDTTQPGARVRSIRGTGYVNENGYRELSVGGRKILEHRLMFEVAKGRRLFSHENVHHLNGDRLDNRPENLELWSTLQPKGQRVADKVVWAKELLALYEPESLANPGGTTQWQNTNVSYRKPTGRTVSDIIDAYHAA